MPETNTPQTQAQDAAPASKPTGASVGKKQNKRKI